MKENRPQYLLKWINGEQAYHEFADMKAASVNLGKQRITSYGWRWSDQHKDYIYWETFYWNR